MTIKVEREALLRVLERPPQYSPIEDASGDFLLVDYGNLINNSDDVVEKPQRSTVDDEDSVFTVSTASFSDTDSEDAEDIGERRVSFAEDLVTEEWTRPFTAKEDLPLLFYSAEETQQFRQEYRMERKLLSELSIDPDTFPVDNNEELSSLVANSCSQPAARHSISRVVVLHENKLETFFTPSKQAPVQNDDVDVFFDNDSFWSGSITWY